MKKLLIAVLLCFGTAQAAPIAYITNKAGGKIVLTDDKGRCTNQNRLAYSTTESNRTILGCWTVDAMYVHILWDDNEIRSYPLENWEFIKPLKSERGL